MQPVYTIGYEGTDIDTFVETLRVVGIKRLADVRAVPVSRKRGFSKSALRERLTAAGIEYVHLVELGDPKPGRDAARSGDLTQFRAIYGAHLRRTDAKAALEVLSELVAETATCLLCFERNHECCHRNLITNHPKMRGFKTIHLCADDPARYARNPSKLPRHSAGKSAAAAE